MKEARNENWSDLMVEISPSHQAYWGLAKALKWEENPSYGLEHVSRVEEEVRHIVHLPPKDKLDPVTNEEVSKHVKGIKIDKHLHFRDHIARIRKLALFYLSRLYGMIGRKSKMSLRNKHTIYSMCIKPVMTYASPVFAYAQPDTLYDLQVGQNKFCRRAADAPSYVKKSASPKAPNHFQIYEGRIIAFLQHSK
ncbi:Probable RNA-directed DNA polymerase from transposon BS [Eumeta japonica]|uniref:Probable RNA-directed DNA polymerase from transposon BS n=1 Tax=Eumeta variegata TaxID=151549 RepID=A0A4C1TRY0_EUMVA|nr:Probable RNA-directed DNA polymerase from transposon BS [Eumeta japonica]